MTTPELSDRSVAAGTRVRPGESLRQDLQWVGPIAAVVGVFAAVTLLRSAHVGIPMRDPHGDILLDRIAISLGLFVVYGVVDALVRTRRLKLPLRRTWAVAHARWTPRRLVLALGALAAYHVTYFCYHNLKSWDVFNAPRDAMLLQWDRWLFLGHSPAVLLHDLLGQGGSAWVLAYWYETFGTLVLFAVVAPVVFVDRIRDGLRGDGVRGLDLDPRHGVVLPIPSLGPFDSAPQEFAGLPHMMIQDTQARYMGQRAHMLADPRRTTRSPRSRPSPACTSA